MYLLRQRFKKNESFLPVCCDILNKHLKKIKLLQKVYFQTIKHKKQVYLY